MNLNARVRNRQERSHRRALPEAFYRRPAKGRRVKYDREACRFKRFLAPVNRPRRNQRDNPNPNPNPGPDFIDIGDWHDEPNWEEFAGDDFLEIYVWHYVRPDTEEVVAYVLLEIFIWHFRVLVNLGMFPDREEVLPVLMLIIVHIVYIRMVMYLCSLLEA